MSNWLPDNETSDGKTVTYFNGDGYVKLRDYEALQEEVEKLTNDVRVIKEDK